MIWDVYLYNGEDDQVAMRYSELAELDQDVMHVAVQGDRTFQGDPKEVRWPDFAIGAGMVVEIPELLDDPWQREAYQRNQMVLAFDDAPDSDYVIIGEADEVPRASVIQRLIDEPLGDEVVALMTPYYYYGIDLMVSWDHSMWSTFATAGMVRTVTPQGCRSGPTRHERDAGWHFTQQGGADAVWRKFRQFSHSELRHLTREDIQRCISLGVDYDTPPRGELIPVEIDDYYPRCIREIPERWKHMLWENVR